MLAVNLKELSEFLREAKRQTYANASAPKVVASRIGSKDYHFERAPYAYHDTYFGGRKFIGNEIVYHQDIPLWGMGYFGRVLVENMNEEALDKCLRQALMQEDLSVLPLRGPASYSLCRTNYQFSTTGSLDDFTGIEEISQENKVIYRCNVHGGLILK